jgi:phosphocarrier protein
MTEDLQPAANKPSQVLAAGSTLLFHDGGLHARPAIKLTKLAKRFLSEVRVGLSVAGPWINAKSIASVMAMKTPTRTTLFFEAQGSDAHDAVAALVNLVASDFAGVPEDGD